MATAGRSSFRSIVRCGGNDVHRIEPLLLLLSGTERLPQISKRPRGLSTWARTSPTTVLPVVRCRGQSQPFLPRWRYAANGVDHATGSYVFARVRSMMSSHSGDDKDRKSAEEHHRIYQQQMEELRQEREALFGFTEDDHAAWSSYQSNQSLNSDNIQTATLEEIERARTQYHEQQEGNNNNNTHNKEPSSSDVGVVGAPQSDRTGLTHVSEDGRSVQMVDIGGKRATQRRAIGQTKVLLPPAIVQALRATTTSTIGRDPTASTNNQDDDVVGPKGPVFATAKLAGIMAAKRTSDLIPLCHPLPLDRVHVDIAMENPATVLIRCECRTTHKTGVEMEALVGATVAALTVYDMLKAISSDMVIEQTQLVHKSGGKHDVNRTG